MTNIEWCDYTINPVAGCSKCSPGCVNCYAEKFAARLAKNPSAKARYAGVVSADGKWTGRISAPDWTPFKRLPKSPRKVFVGSMTDIFHDKVKDGQYHHTILPRLFDIMASLPHTFMFLTKRPENMKAWIDFTFEACIDKSLPNVWLGVTVCNQEEADEKLPVLMQIPAAKRFVSVEPMLGPVNLTLYLSFQKDFYSGDDTSGFIDYEQLLSWVICGGETGPGARPMHSDWVKGLRDQCENADVPFFFKSWGDWWPCSQMPDDFDCSKYPVGDIGNDGIFIPPPALEIPMRNGVCSEQTFKVGKRLSGYLIDGKEYRQFPEAE